MGGFFVSLFMSLLPPRDDDYRTPASNSKTPECFQPVCNAVYRDIRAARGIVSGFAILNRHVQRLYPREFSGIAADLLARTVVGRYDFPTFLMHDPHRFETVLSRSINRDFWFHASVTYSIAEIIIP